MSELHILIGGERLWTHNLKDCDGRALPCSIHSPSDHHMLGWPQHWRDDAMIMERICQHGIGHPDPDDYAYRKSIRPESTGIHGCDGCCIEPGVTG
jgi:hypothetical protein